jgi:UTP:GlnB (protein PII) uridylyltransferase
VTEALTSTAEFAASLPTDYRERFTDGQIAIHAEAAESRRRTGHLVAASLFPWSEPGTQALCVVAEDRPGLLSKLSRALTQLGCDVDSALAFTRSVERKGFHSAEAVDFFFIRTRSESTFDERKVSEFVELTERILRENRDTVPPPTYFAPKEVSDTTVRFLEDKNGALTVLEVETSDRSGLLWALTRALYQENVQITASKISTVGGRVHDRFVLSELNGSPIGPERRLVIQVAVLTALA